MDVANCIEKTSNIKEKQKGINETGIIEPHISYPKFIG